MVEELKGYNYYERILGNIVIPKDLRNYRLGKQA